MSGFGTEQLAARASVGVHVLEAIEGAGDATIAIGTPTQPANALDVEVNDILKPRSRVNH